MCSLFYPIGYCLWSWNLKNIEKRKAKMLKEGRIMLKKKYRVKYYCGGQQDKKFFFYRNALHFAKKYPHSKITRIIEYK